jgi:hypothetical protein
LAAPKREDYSLLMMIVLRLQTLTDNFYLGKNIEKNQSLKQLELLANKLILNFMLKLLQKEFLLIQKSSSMKSFGRVLMVFAMLLIILRQESM